MAYSNPVKGSAIGVTMTLAASTLTGCAALNIFSDATPAKDPVEAAADRIGGGSPEERIAASSLAESEANARIDRAMMLGQIVTGMKKEQVQAIWGEPAEVETAGDFHEGNQRWVYRDGVSTRWGLKPSRQVYFEHGRVVGWQLNP